MELKDFYYDLPKERIAQEGLKDRDQARLLVLNADGTFQHQQVGELAALLKQGDLLILNDTRVSKSRLLGKKETGGKIDCLILPNLETGYNGSPEREVLLRGSKIRPGTKIIFHRPSLPSQPSASTETLEAQVLEHFSGARYKIQFNHPGLIAAWGQLPLPPYIKKETKDEDRYQTVYSKLEGSLAAPTAGLHFTEALIQNLKLKGVRFSFLTLHVGIGTFAPIRTETVEDWKMHAEHYQITQNTALEIQEALKSRKRIFAVGTTTVRVLETMLQKGGIAPSEGWTDIFIYPGYSFRFPYAGLMTNFHLPESTLLLLTAAFAGREKILSAYQEAIEQKYRFYSFGDAMLIFK